MDNIFFEFNKYLNALRKHPSAILHGNLVSFENYANFLSGYITAIDVLKGINLEREISKWYQNKVSVKAPNMFWFAQFELVNKDKTEEQKIIILLDDLDIFCREYFNAINH